MNKHLWVKQVHEICLDESIEHDFDLLSSAERDRFNESELNNAAELIRNADGQMQAAIKRLMRLSI